MRIPMVWVIIREGEKEIDRIFSETQQLENPHYHGKCNLWRQWKMEAGDFWYQEEGSCRT